MTDENYPTFFVSHGGGPWPFVDGMKQQFALTEREFRKLSERLPTKPKAQSGASDHGPLGGE